MSPFQVINTFRAELESSVQETIQVASTTPPEGSDAWTSYMESHGEIPKSGEERKQLLALKEGVRGALPIEVRLILEKHKSKATQKLHELKQEFGETEWWPRVETPVRKLIDEFILNGIKKYVGETGPKTVSAQSIFTNSLQTSVKYYSEVQTAGTKSEKCPTCMAARPAGTSLTTCAFCGSPIFTA